MKSLKISSLALLSAFSAGMDLGAASAEEKPASAKEVVIHVTAKKFEYNPANIIVEKGVPVVLEIEALDRKHGFKVPELGLEAVVKGGETAQVRFTPDKVGKFPFHCNAFCGSGHEDMKGSITVVEKK